MVKKNKRRLCSRTAAFLRLKKIHTMKNLKNEKENYV